MGNGVLFSGVLKKSVLRNGNHNSSRNRLRTNQGERIMPKEFHITPEEIRAKQQAAMAERPEIEAGLKLVEQAAQAQTVLGWIRRQIHATPQVSLKTIWLAAGITHLQLKGFLEGQDELTTSQVDAICEALGVVPAGAEKVA
jgi:hypothetical protein